MKYNLVTQKGYSLFEVASALQKSIRRAEEREALYWAHELELSGFGKYLWKRLTIISIEDIGPASQQSISLIIALKTAYEALQKAKSFETNLTIAAAVLTLSRAPKSRVFDWAKVLMMNTHNHHNQEVPDYALDIHTRRGKQHGKTVEDFFKSGCLVHPHAPVDGEEDYKEEVRKLACEMTDDEREELEMCKTLPDHHPDYTGYRKPPKEAQAQQELF